MDDLRATWYTSSCLSRGIFLPLLVFGFYFCPWLGCDDGAFARFSLVDIVLISEVRIFEKTRTNDVLHVGVPAAITPATKYQVIRNTPSNLETKRNVRNQPRYLRVFYS